MVYDVLAPIYDRIMNHVAYDDWIHLIRRVTEKFLTNDNPSVFELGGGTGILGNLLIENGYRYLGSDRSPAMCSRACSRNVPFICTDARFLPLKNNFDLFLFLYDGINYLQSPDEYTALFKGVHEHLEPGGLFLFDITTEANSLRHFKSYLEFEDWGDYSYVRRSYYSKIRQEQHNDFTIYHQMPGTSHYERLTENHCQKIFSTSIISKAVPKNLFSIEGIWDGYSFHAHRPHSERIHFLLKKRSK